MPLAGLYPSLATPAHRRLWLGIVPYHAAFQIGLVTTGFAAASLSDSALAVGLAVGAWGLPILVLPPVGGVAADRLSRRRVMLAAQVVLGGSALAVALLALGGLLATWHLVLLGLVQGTTYSFFAPSRTAYTAGAVGRGLFPNAIAAYSLSEHVTAVGGPILGGLLLTLPLGVPAGYFAIALLHLLVLGIFVGLPEQPRGLDGEIRLAERILEGLRHVRRSPVLGRVLLVAAAAMLLGMPYQRLMPIFAEDVFRVGSTGLGLLLGASGGGAIAGALLASRLGGGRGPAAWQGPIGAAFGLAAAGFGVAPTFELAVVAAALAGLAWAIFAIANYSLLIGHADHRLYGRVASLYQLTFGLGPIGAIPVGAIADAIGAPAAVALGGVLLVGVALALSPRAADRTVPETIGAELGAADPDHVAAASPPGTTRGARSGR